MDQGNVYKKPSNKTKNPIGSGGLGSNGKPGVDANKTDHSCKNVQADCFGGIKAQFLVNNEVAKFMRHLEK